MVGGGVPAPHPHSHRNLRQTLSSSASAGKPFLPEALPHCPVSLVPCSSSQQTPWMPLTFSSWEVASAIPRFSSWWGRGGILSPNSFSMWECFFLAATFFYTLQTNAPALLRVLLSIMWAEHLLYTNKTHEEYTGIYRIVNGRSCNGDPVNGDRNGSPVGCIAGHFISESVGHPSSPPGLRLAKMHRSIHSLSEPLFSAPWTRQVRTEP